MVENSDQEALAQQVDSLIQREAVKNLRYKYCYFVDSGQWEDFIGLFTETGSIEFPQPEVDRDDFRGKDELREFCMFLEENRLFMSHMVHNPLIELSSDSATGQWYFEVPEVETGPAVWVQGKYEEEYRRVGDEWKFETVGILFNYKAEYNEGWADAVKDFL